MHCAHSYKHRVRCAHLSIKYDMQCNHCNKTFASVYSMKRHKNNFHEHHHRELDQEHTSNDDDSGSITADSVDDGESEDSSMDTEVVNPTTKGTLPEKADVQDDDDESNDDAERKMTSKERDAWFRFLKIADLKQLGDIIEKCEKVEDFWENEDVFKAVLTRMQHTMASLEGIMEQLSTGVIYPYIQAEIVRLEDYKYLPKEAKLVAWKNRSYLVRKVLKKTRDQLEAWYIDTGVSEAADDNDEHQHSQ